MCHRSNKTLKRGFFLKKDESDERIETELHPENIPTVDHRDGQLPLSQRSYNPHTVRTTVRSNTSIDLCVCCVQRKKVKFCLLLFLPVLVVFLIRKCFTQRGREFSPFLHPPRSSRAET